MAKSASVIEINGRRYDATTGKLLGAVQQAAAAIKPATGQVLDGFVKRSSTVINQTAKLSPQPTIKQASRRAAQAIHQKTQRSETIMRSVVAKPKLKSSPRPAQTNPPQRRTGLVSARRVFRAKTVLRSPRISRFAPKSAAPAKAAEGEVLPRSAAAKAATSTKALSRPLPSLVATISHNQIERMLDQALARADAHKKALKERTRGPLKHFQRLPRWLNAAIVLVLVIAVGGLFAWQRVPELSLKVAASRAHVQATTPAYIPDGYSLASPIQYQTGTVKMELRSSADKTKNVTITQQASSLNSESLKASIIPASAPLQTSEVNGTPLYIFGKNNDAVFKKGNTKVLINNHANLPPSELSNIAKGLIN